MLEEKEKLGTDDFRRMQRDQTSPFAEKMTREYLAALGGNTEGIYEQAREILEQWDYNLNGSSPAALISEMVWLQLHSVIFHDELGDELYPLMLQNSIIARHLINRIRVTGESVWCDNVSTPGKKETFSDNIVAAFHQAVDTLSTMYGDDPAQWRWDNLHKVAFMHPLGGVSLVEKLFRVNRGPYPIGGSFHTVSPYTYPLGTSFIANHGASERHIFNTADWDRSLTVIPTGTSGVPASPHFMDQTRLYVDNRFHRDLFTEEAVKPAMKYKAIFY
jgi:penicillin amidase